MSTQQIQLRADLFTRIEEHVGMVEGLQDQLQTAMWELGRGNEDEAVAIVSNIAKMAEALRQNLITTGTEIRNRLPVIPGRTS